MPQRQVGPQQQVSSLFGTFALHWHARFSQRWQVQAFVVMVVFVIPVLTRHDLRPYSKS